MEDERNEEYYRKIIEQAENNPDEGLEKVGEGIEFSDFIKRFLN